MKKAVFTKRTEQLLRDLESFGKRLPAAYKKLKFSKLAFDGPALLPKIVKKDWRKVAAICRAKQRDIKLQEQMLQRLQTAYNGFFTRLVSLKAGFKEHYQRPNTSPDWEDVVQRVRDELEGSGADTADIEEYLERLGNKGGLQAYEMYRSQIDDATSLVQYAVRRATAARLYFYQAMVLARFNSLSQRRSAPPVGALSQVRALDKTATRQQNKVHTLLKASSLSRLAEHLERHTKWLSETIEDTVLPILVSCHAIKAAAGHTSAIEGRRAMEVGTLFQKLLYDMGECLMLKWVVAWHPESDLLRRYVEKARTLANAPLEWQGEPRTIEALVSNLSANHGRQVIVEGTIAKLKIKHVGPGKVVSTAQLVDADENRINLVLPYMKLDSGGLVNRSYARIQGKFDKNHADTGGKPAVALARWPLEKLSASSWRAWLRYQMRTILQVPSHNLVMTFSLEPGPRSAMNPIIFEITASAPEPFTLPRM